MRKREIDRKLDEIIDFSGVERYIDTPVKRYSSGMYVRLAFAVAAHLESEILIVDEVLAVGDAEFQKKCLGKMGEVSKGEGRTVLFVSHNMESILQLTTKSILLKNGLIHDYDFSQKVIVEMNSTDNPNTYYTKTDITRLQNRIISCRIRSKINKVLSGEDLEIEMVIINFSKNLFITIQIFNELNSPVAILPINLSNIKGDDNNIINLELRIKKLLLYKGFYSLTFHLGDSMSKEHFESVENICPFEVYQNEVSLWQWNLNDAKYVPEIEFSFK
jgi:lipopolysaccharide transport system ATP-binding protein